MSDVRAGVISIGVGLVFGASLAAGDSWCKDNKLCRVINTVESAVSVIFAVAVYNQNTFPMSDKMRAGLVIATLVFTCISKIALSHFSQTRHSRV
ncbi:hypothetical protein K0U07_02415 [bacterium]|nr:hypothetical protein [bacterium]